MTQCQIALGGNVGDVRAAFREALDHLRCPGVEIVAISPCYETPPMGEAAGATFLNAAASIETTLDAETLLGRLLATEDRLGRVREVHWGPRVIDLDLILYGNEITETPTLRVPHPAAWYRRFVLEPLAAIAPEVIHPEAKESLAVLRERILVRPFRIAVEEPEVRSLLEREFSDFVPDVVWCDADASEPVMRLLAGDACSSAAERTVGVPREPVALMSNVRAILMAALGEPRAVGAI